MGILTRIFGRKQTMPESITLQAYYGEQDGLILLTKQGILVFTGNPREYRAFLSDTHADESCVTWGTYDSVKESFWLRKYPD